MRHNSQVLSHFVSSLVLSRRLQILHQCQSQWEENKNNLTLILFFCHLVQFANSSQCRLNSKSVKLIRDTEVRQRLKIEENLKRILLADAHKQTEKKTKGKSFKVNRWHEICQKENLSWHFYTQTQNIHFLVFLSLFSPFSVPIIVFHSKFNLFLTAVVTYVFVSHAQYLKAPNRQANAYCVFRTLELPSYFPLTHSIITTTIIIIIIVTTERKCENRKSV